MIGIASTSHSLALHAMAESHTLLSMTTTTDPISYDTLHDMVEEADKQKARVDALLAERQKVDDEALRWNRNQLSAAREKTHCYADRDCCPDALFLPVLLVLVVAAITTIILICIESAGKHATLGHWISCIALPWAAFPFIALYHMPVCMRRGWCGCCRSCPCSK